VWPNGAANGLRIVRHRGTGGSAGDGDQGQTEPRLSDGVADHGEHAAVASTGICHHRR